MFNKTFQHPSISQRNSDEMHRLLLLENAMLNYSGGLVNLTLRARQQARELQESQPEAAQLLKDVACYLHDVEVCGQLDIAWSRLND